MGHVTGYYKKKKAENESSNNMASKQKDTGRMRPVMTSRRWRGYKTIL
jgi:hypothetical protein